MPAATTAGDDIRARFGVGPDDFIGSGAQSEVFALGADHAHRVLRIFRDPADPASLTRLQAFLATIDGRVPIPTPAIVEIDPDGRYTVERRLPGTSLLRLLPTLVGERRRTAIRNFVAGADAMGTVPLPDRSYGHVLAAAPIHADTWTGFLRLSLNRAIAANGAVIAAEAGDVAALRARALALLAALPDRPPKALVHGDWFPGNVLIDTASLAVTGLVDFSGYTLAGDPLYDALTAPIFLDMIEEATAADIAYAQGVLAARHGDTVPAQRFYRAHAAFWMADPAYALPPYPRIYPWAIAELRRLAGDP